MSVDAQVYGQIVVIVVQTALGILAPLLVALLVLLLKKAGLDVTEKQEAQLTYVAREAAKKMEEIAAAKFKATGEKMTPAEKIAGAVATVLDELPKTSPDKAALKVTTALPDLGIGAAVTLAHPSPAPEKP